MKQLYLISIILFLQFSSTAQLQDSGISKKDSVSLVTPIKEIPVIALTKLLNNNRFLNSKGLPVSLTQLIKRKDNKDYFFYLLMGLILVFGIAKAAYSRYFSNMFRVFFNSSLRQSQLTDQLVQDQLPSLIFNIFFLFIGGIYAYLLMDYFHYTNSQPNWYLLGISVVIFCAVYFIKFLTLKFTGWITGYKQEADIYIFIVFLINKIIAICLLPIVIIMAFAEQKIIQAFVLISFILVGTLLLMRFFKSYSLLQHRLKVSRFHFFLYVFSVEILPLFIIYKAAVLFLSISL